MTTLVTPSDASSVAAGEVTARVVMVLARRPYTAAYAAVCDHLAELILDEVRRVCAPSVFCFFAAFDCCNDVFLFGFAVQDTWHSEGVAVAGFGDAATSPRRFS